MAKRFTDNQKWSKPFLRGLEVPYKVLWLYALDECDHAGIWQVDIEVARIKTGCPDLEIEDAIKFFGDKIIMINDNEKMFIPDFINFQYGELNPENRAHLSVIQILNRHGIDEYFKPLTRCFKGRKDKDMDKDMDKDTYKDLYEKILFRLNSSCQTKFRVSPSTSSKINARIEEGYALEDFYKVIDTKANQWINSKEMKRFLRPITLFGNKFESYLNEWREPQESKVVTYIPKEENTW